MLNTSYYEQRKLETLVENRTIYTLKNAELNVFETHSKAEKVALRFDEPVLASMLRGKKVMHLREDNSFDFYPGESVVLPAGELMQIDFPEATLDNPTQCLALSIDNQRIKQVTDFLNETQPRADEDKTWRFTDYNFHFTNETAVNQIIERLIFLFTENHPSKDLFADFMLKELIIRLMQSEARHLLVDNAYLYQDNSRLAYVIQFIKEHLQDSLTIEQLSRQACMSQSHFFRCFKNELGISPVDFINLERVKLAKNILKNPRKAIPDACFESGFNNLSYFNKIFKRLCNMTPKQFKIQVTQF